ncbi:MAG: hypothetical protein ACPGXL_03035 [Chitinophagales bacterium]
MKGVIKLLVLIVVTTLCSWQLAAQDISLVLIGVVSNEDGVPKDDVTVELKDQKSNQIQEYRTDESGSFYFQLVPDRAYYVSMIGENGENLENKPISTEGKTEPEVMHTILIWNDKPFLTSTNADKGNFRTPASRVTANATYDLSFKIQLGAFRTNYSKSDPFLTDTEMNVIEEQTPSGFYRYMVGNYGDLQDAKNANKKLSGKGYENTFIVAYYKGERLKDSPEAAVDKYDR